MKSLFKSAFFCWAYLFLLCLGYIGAGWLLAAYQVSWLIWLGTLLAIVHLSIAETGAIVLANTWLVLIILLGIFFNTKISLNFLPLYKAQIWAIGLLVVWIFAILLILMLAFAQTPLKTLDLGRIGKSQKRISYFLIFVTWIAIKLGYLIYKLAS
jgi:hypothetical protein